MKCRRPFRSDFDPPNAQSERIASPPYSIIPIKPAIDGSVQQLGEVFQRGMRATSNHQKEVQFRHLRPFLGCLRGYSAPQRDLVKRVSESITNSVNIGSHGHGVLETRLTGNVEERMVRKAIIPTLVEWTGRRGAHFHQPPNNRFVIFLEHHAHCYGVRICALSISQTLTLEPSEREIFSFR